MKGTKRNIKQVNRKKILRKLLARRFLSKKDRNNHKNLKMGRKAKDAAMDKITRSNSSSRRNLSAAKTTTITTTNKKQNANTSQNENRTPLKTQSQSTINTMKNCSVHLDKLSKKTISDSILSSSKQQLNDENISETQTTVDENMFADENASTTMKNCSVSIEKMSEKSISDVILSPKQRSTNANRDKVKTIDDENVYDYTFDSDAIPINTSSGNVMKDLFDKLAKENKIEMKKYRPKHGKKATTKKTEKNEKQKVTRKRRQVKQSTETEPPQKKPNLNANKVDNTNNNNLLKSSNIDANETTNDKAAKNDANDNILQNVGVSNIQNPKINREPVITSETKKVVFKDNAQPSTSSAYFNNENVNTRPRIRNANLSHFQSTPKSSTPLSSKQSVTLISNINKIDFSMESSISSNESPSIPTNPLTTRVTRRSANQNSLQQSSIQQIQSQNDDIQSDSEFFIDDFDSINPMPSASSAVDKENVIGAKNYSTSNRSNASRMTLSNSDASNSPTQHRVYGRSPLKNIVSSQQKPNLNPCKLVNNCLFLSDKRSK